MHQNGSLYALLLVLNLTSLIETDTGELPLPQEVHIESTNMKHLLKWSALKVSCHPVSYSVQYQGFFELYIKNGSWEDAPVCQLIRSSVCDLTPGLGSDSDYNVRVRAECRGRVSGWASTGKPFNRRETNLTAPSMNVSVFGDSILVEFSDLPETLEVTLKHWRRGQERGVSTHRIIANPFHLGGLEEGATYCLSALIALHNRNSSSTEAQCLHISRSMLPWLKSVIVCVAVVTVTGLGLAVFWCTKRCFPTLLYTCWPKEPVPDVLLHREPRSMLKITPEESHELCQPVLVLLPTQS
ncbi:hypothetical protein AAFF_G00303900 [Aldrovandia affinis]|uniref:Fibronectin type-III domain-containing protein n=1 Tax=Aldrovandia affinis TaxID=143900 RepID=A0AAD7SP59_9TELE|nr:hypothetical protein AAFF_G00303900 [Aldrovandia affinis]